MDAKKDMAWNNHPILIHCMSTFMDMLEGKWNGMFYNIFECEILFKRTWIDYKLRITNHPETSLEEIECLSASNWSIFSRGQSKITWYSNFLNGWHFLSALNMMWSVDTSPSRDWGITLFSIGKSDIWKPWYINKREEYPAVHFTAVSHVTEKWALFSFPELITISFKGWVCHWTLLVFSTTWKDTICVLKSQTKHLSDYQTQQL